MTRKSDRRRPGRDDPSTLKSVERASRDAARFELAGDLVVTLRGDGLLLHLSPGWEPILGAPVGPMCGCFLDQLPGHSSTAKQLFETLHQALATPKGSRLEESVYLHYPSSDGQPLTMEGHIYLGASGTDEMLATFRDVTAGWNRLAEIAESEKRFRIIAEAGRDMVTETNEEGIFTSVSSGSLSVLGYRPSELIGTSPRELLHDEDAKSFLSQFFKGSDTERPFVVKPHRLRHRDGSWVWVEAIGFRTRDSVGKARMLGVARDITSQREAKDSQREPEERVLRSQKLESLGVLAGGIAHDFNNFLTPIIGNAGLLLLDLPEDSPLRKRAEMIRSAANRATALTRQMLAYAGHGVPEVSAVDISEQIREMTLLIDATASHSSRLHYDLEEQLPLIQVDSTHIGQVVMNLVANASESLPASGGKIEIRTGSLIADRSMIDACFIGNGMEEGNAVFIEVRDDGAGIAQEHLPRILDPFYTTRFEGRGLGLAAVHGIVRGYRGAIELHTEPGYGTRIRILFPAAPANTREAGLQAEDESLAGRFAVQDRSQTHTALVVDDDEGSRELISSTLSRAGIRILEAKDGPEAIQLFERWNAEIGVVVLDCTMPGFSGERVFEALREIRTDVQIILVSGYSRERVADALLERGADAFLQKPFEPDELIKALKKLVKLDAG